MAGGQATEACCSALEAALGPEANTSMRNCLCVESVWDDVTMATDQLAIPMRRILDACNSRLGARVPYYQGEGVGLCAGAPMKVEPSYDPPRNPEEVCTGPALYAPLAETTCRGAVSGSEMEEACCRAFDRVIGAGSNESTRNCECVPSVRAESWEFFGALGLPIGDLWSDCK
ncbi:unnamed protein product [Ostreobium quekettii]|uniref:Uncharacterized protein n=1 Tax=Ostreobium quekettii TaxID=121088 RepID=A0A8S1IRT5_9CHLO|nr:unnamed protein product [Ostreobium quekettii]|eukprot:evm.model.scf_307EXC.9 EVM.evm.TU.scf_307EXC.9   scf_307EXC:93368-94625(+)